MRTDTARLSETFAGDGNRNWQNKNGFQLDGCFEPRKICDECAVFGGSDCLGKTGKG